MTSVRKAGKRLPERIGAPDITLVQESGAGYLQCNLLRRRVDVDEFRAWAAYSGIEVKALVGAAFQVILRDERQWELFKSEWLGPDRWQSVQL